MGFSAKQLQALRRNVEERYIRTRENNGKELTYIEGWYAVAQANRIFGFDGWSRETVESKCVLARENRGAFLAVYTAKVRLTVYAGSSPPIIREGHGTGEGRAGTPGEVHDTALKAAETDATKRALATFGRPFGLELYRGQSRDARTGKVQPRALPRPEPHSPSPSQASLEPSPSIVPRPQDVHHGAILSPDADGPVPSPQSAKTYDQGPGSQASDRSETRTAKAIAAPDGGDPGRASSDARQAEQAQSRSSDEPALPLAPALPPDDTSPIPRPSRFYGRREYLASRERNGALMNELARRAEASLSEAPAKIDKSVLTFGEPKRLRDKAHLRFVASQPCLICGRQPADAHHLRFAQPRALGRKVSDEYTVPLCRGHHRQVHQTGNEPAFWEDLDINALEIAKGLWEQSRGLAE